MLDATALEKLWTDRFKNVMEQEQVTYWKNDRENVTWTQLATDKTVEAAKENIEAVRRQ